MRRYRVAIVEPAPLVKEGVSSMLSHSCDIDVVMMCSSVEELVSRMRSIDIDLLMVSTSLIDRVVAASELRDISIVGLQSALCSSDILRKADSVVTLYSTQEELCSAVREAVETPSEKSQAESHELSERERDVLVLVAKGHTNKEIASELNISPHTVISHRKNIVHKTGVRSVAGLTVYAILNGLIESE